jgi:hypothetical protein
MNSCWRITKYNPQYRDSHGAFLKNEWTEYSDIGTIFNHIKFTYEEYAQIENLYVKAIQCFMNCHNIRSLQITTLEKSKKIDTDIHNTDTMIDLFNTIKEKDWLSQNNIEDFCKLILRNKLWCKLIYNEKMFVHFGWDFYMYIGSSLPCTNAISAIQKNGLFVEPFKSPYQM